MKYRKMPGVEDELSVLGFGCMRFPVLNDDISQIDEEKSAAMLRHAIDHGLNYLDTAFPYHGKGTEDGGSSEPFVGRVLQDGYREKVLLASKLPSWLIKTREDMDRFLNKQLERLQTDCIDFYLIHALSRNYWGNLNSLGVKDFLDRALSEGKIKYAGFSFHDDSQDLFKEIVDSYSWSFCQIQYNYMDEDYQAGKVGLDYASEKGMGIVVMEPLKGGSLAVNMPEEANEVFDVANPNRKAVDWALNWLWDQEKIHVVLSGMNTMEQVEENIALAAKSEINAFTQEEKKAIGKVKEIMNGKVQVDCTACGYCLPCPEGVDIPRNFMYYNNYHRFSNPKTRFNAKVMFNNLLSADQKADNCVECGTCEPLCPQNIEIIDKLKQVVETMK